MCAQTVTYAARLHVFLDVFRLRGKYGMPGPLYPNHDYKESLFLASTVGIFSPMPSLSSHQHRDHELARNVGDESSSVSPDFPVARVTAELWTLAKELAFPIPNASHN